MATGAYVLVTAARNEEDFIGTTIEAVLSQTVLPQKWVVVSDGSTDRTDEIVAKAAKRHSFIRLVRREAGGARNFSSKVQAFRMSEPELAGTPVEYLGNLDADVSFPANYYETILQRFMVQPRLGLAGGILTDLIDGHYEELRTSVNSVAGPIQMFRRCCYDDIGGYIPLRLGGIDSAAEIMARARGWDVRTFSDLKVRHHRPVSSRAGGVVRIKLRYGMAHYALGYHPLFELLRCVYRIPERPYIIGSLCLTVGYLWAWLTRIEKAVPEDVVRYLQHEQVDRLRAMCRSGLSRLSPG
jgi:poly-beta-1,6-N-acetyl-D-glucosamine synthase